MTGNFSEWGRSFWNERAVQGGGRLGQFVLGLVFVGVGAAGVFGGNPAAWLLIVAGLLAAAFPIARFVRRHLLHRH